VIVRTTALGATDRQPYRVRARLRETGEVLTESYEREGESLNMADTHERTARALVRSVIGDRAFSIVQTGETVTGYTFFASPH